MPETDDRSWWLRLTSAVVSLRYPIIAVTAVAGLGLIVCAGYTAEEYRLTVLLKIGVALLLATALDITFEFSRPLGPRVTRLLFLVAAVALVVAAWVHNHYAQLLTIELSAGVMLFLVIKFILRKLEHAIRQERARAEQIIALLERIKKSFQIVDLESDDEDNGLIPWGAVPEGYVDDPAWIEAWEKWGETTERARQVVLIRWLVERQVLSIVTAAAGQKDVAVNPRILWSELPAGSIDPLQILSEVESQLSIRLPPGRREKIGGVNDLVAAVLESTPNEST
jgi:acyl carrier protein